MTTPSAVTEERAELFPHGADIGVRGIGRNRNAAFEEAALALASAVVDPARVKARDKIQLRCAAPSDEILLVDWLNAVIYEMAVHRLVFARFRVRIDGSELLGEAWGEPIDVARHQPAVEPKGATYTALKVQRTADGACWIAQCVVDV
jgi:tRNA nucleotidyltransferase (CCA-adding enzyme)